MIEISVSILAGCALVLTFLAIKAVQNQVKRAVAYDKRQAQIIIRLNEIVKELKRANQ